MKARRKLEHQLWQTLRSHDLVGRRFLIACSGGADSVALLRTFAAVRPANEIVVVHIHHGVGNDLYREKAAKFVTEICAQHNISCFVFRNEGRPLRSESEFREFRRNVLEDARSQTNTDFIVTAHHENDLLETRLIRLIRGTSEKGLVAIRPLRRHWFRPFLEIGAVELREYLSEIGQAHLEDPSNRDERFLRNWIRQTWLPALESKRPGSSGKVAKSFETIISSTQRDEIPTHPVIERLVWEKAAPDQRLRLVAGCLEAVGQLEMSRGQLEEIRKRLDNRQREFTFKMGGCVWVVNVQQIHVSRQG